MDRDENSNFKCCNFGTMQHLLKWCFKLEFIFDEHSRLRNSKVRSMFPCLTFVFSPRPAVIKFYVLSSKISTDCSAESYSTFLRVTFSVGVGDLFAEKFKHSVYSIHVARIRYSLLKLHNEMTDS